ncbi:nucleolar pre-ribosomal-associated protein 1 [Silurus asotus]|uniref:Nucleolar pre-ribosomal-associated protein 1 n=1 Tax=Silurus asotus TaxID=30991 RepID=A0AAD5AZB5_SILAS|nr:nucleolar pre-ribosomal-associated protein 1 [Silurus asotus]
MASKRKKNDLKYLMPEKKAKENKSEFNGTVFKTMLKDPSKAFKALETFIGTAKQLPCANLYDVVEGYIKISAECAEILALLEGDTRSETELMLIFQSLELILLRIASDLSCFNPLGSSIVKKIVSSHMKLLQSSLCSGNHQFVQRCLCLMTAMVSQGTESANEMFNSLVFNKPLSNLAHKRDRTGRPDIRMSYIQFALSFLMYGDTATIIHALDTKDFLSEILNTELKEDRISTISLILSTFQTKARCLIFLGAISMSWFTSCSLQYSDYLCRTMNEQEKGRLVVRESVHSFLLDLCCSRKHGISFHDTSLGTIGRAGNIVLLQFVVSLKQAVEDEKVAELLISILKSNPDILHRYFMETQICFTPRMKGAWLDSITLLKKIYQSQPEVSQAFQLQEMVPVPQLLSMVLVTTLPPVCNKAFFTQGLNLNSVLGQHVTLSVIAFILRRAQKNIVFSLERPMLDSFDGCERNAKDEFVQLYRGALSKVLPDIMSIVSKWQSLSKYEKKEDELQIGLSKLSAEEEVTAHKHGDQNQRLILFKALLLQVICLYQKVVPHLVTESKFDFSKLFKGIVSEKGMNDDVPPILQYQILQLALELPASKFSWFRFQDVMAPEFEGRDSSVLYMLLKMFVNCSNTQLRSATKMLIIKVLRESGAFEHNWKELELWLNQLVLLQPSQQETVIHFLDLVLMRVVLNPYKYMDTVADMVQEAVCLQAKIRGQDWDSTFASITCIDDVPGVDDVIIEANGKDPDNIGLSLTDDIILQTFPFSAAVPAVLEARNKQQAAFIDGKSVLCEYICAVLCDILHSQRDPLALCLTLQSYDKELLSSENLSTRTSISDFHMYYYKWLNQLHQETLFSPVQTTTTVPASDFSAYMKACYCAGPSTFLKDSFWKGLEKSLSTLKLSEFIGAVSQTLIYLKSFVETFCSVLLTVFKLVFKHPVLQQYFLALELRVMPSHSLDSERMRQLSRQLTNGVLKLLMSCVETLKTLNGMDVINPYLSAIQGALLSELKQINRCLVEESQTVEAFLALHEYIDPSSVSEVLTALLLLPQSSLLAGGDKMSLYGHTLLKILTKSISDTCDGSTTHSLSQVHLRSLAALHSSCYTTELEEIFLQVLHRDPGCAKLIPTDVLLHCLQFSSSLELAALLVQHCSTHCLTFELWCLEQSNLAHITAQNSGFLPLLSSYFQQVTTDDPCRPKEVQKAVLQVLTKYLLDKLSCSVMQEHADVPLELGVELLSSLIPLGAMDIELTKLMQGLPVLLEKPETSDQRWQLADIITKKLTCTPEHMQWRKSLLTSSLRWLSATYKEHMKPLIKTEETMLHRLKSLLISSEDVMDLDWNTFVKSGLKHRYKDKMFLSTLNYLLEPMYGSVLSSKELLPISTIHMMVTSHSLFMPTMLAPLDDTDIGPYSKEALVTLLLTLVRKCPEVCKSNHFHVLLGAYGATLSNTDQKMLLLLKEYEKNNMSLMEFQYLLWGHAAVEYHKARKSLGPSLWQQLNSESLLDQLIEDRMLNTITHFPLNKCLVPQENEDLDSKDEKEGSPDQMCLYDPAFLIPLFSYIVRPEALLDCRTFVSRHALGLTVVALSSYDHKMRAAAYHVLGSFYQHLESGHFKEKKQLIYLLDTIRNAIQKQNLRVSFMHAVYIAKVAQQILRPEEHMYLVISKFLLGSQYVDLKRVPDFFRLFYSFDLEHKLERDWLLKVLEMGMRDGLCYELCEQHSIFHTLLGFSSSPLCDQSVQNQIVNVLCKTAQLPKASHDFSKAHGILTWILQLTKRENVDRRMPTILIGLLYNLWFSLLGKTSRMQWSNIADMQLKSLGKCLPFSLVNDFLCALLSVIRYLSGVEPSDMESFLQILHSVLKHHGTALNSNKDTNWLHPQTLSCTAAVNLLYCWGKLASDSKLLCCLHGLLKLQNIKILHGAWQEKVQGTDNCKDCHKEKYMQSLIKCKPLLLSVLTHWDPWSDENSNPASVLPPNSSCLHSDKTASLMTATAHTLIKWTLWTLSEMPFDEYLTFATLKWMEKVIVPHEAIARSLISDEAMRTDLLKLYQQTCEQSAYKLDTLQVFTTVMVHLLDVGEKLHKNIIRVCSYPTDDQVKKEIGLKLLSLYIPEIWCGAKVPQLLLMHAQLITRRRKDSQKSSRTHIMQICEDILSAVD